MSMIRRIPMDGVMNFRDLGGFACPGGVTRWNRIYRSAALADATPEDVERLRRRNIRLVLDLRYPHEVQARPDVAIPGVQNLNFPLLGDFPMDKLPINGEVKSTRSLYRMYRLMLRHGGEAILGAFRALLACDGAVLFHCAAGKDRTGVFTMLLLALAGVEWADILADYTVSELYLEGLTTTGRLKGGTGRLPQPFRLPRGGQRTGRLVITHKGMVTCLDVTMKFMSTG